MNDPFQINRRMVLLSAVLVFVIVLISGGISVYVFSDRELIGAISWTTVALDVHERYPTQLDWDALLDRAMDAMMARLDRYSGYVEREQLEQMDEELTGSYYGIGVSIIEHSQGLLIMSVREHGPAAGAALLTGDIILKADTASLAELTGIEASQLLRGPEGTPVDLTVYRPTTDDTTTVTVTRRRIDLMHIPFAGFTPDSMLYLRLLDFDAGAAEDTRKALDSLLEPGKPQARGIILDLRGNPGGLFSEAYRTADLFLEDGQLIVGTDARSQWDSESYRSSGKDMTDNLPMAVVVDRGTASAAEIVAGSLRELGRAVLIGDTTFGKGLVQGFARLGDGSGLRLTISRYYLQGGIYLNEFDSTLNDIGHGLVPDHYFSFINRHEFPRRLENSLLLQEFAIANEEEIIASGPEFRLGDQWVDRFKEFADDNEFSFVSRATRGASLLVDIARLDRARVQTYKLCKQLHGLSQKHDLKQFSKYADYIKMRLKQVAYERRFGIYRAYADAVIQERTEIRLAARILQAERPD
ncbi:MAG: PDZ domain-containing protein [Candidatus Zixiibacteriota bacterium]|nr:MAG: PDZ domain-containing protein [candidate division Zixibacteria bacterium]